MYIGINIAAAVKRANITTKAVTVKSDHQRNIHTLTHWTRSGYIDVHANRCANALYVHGRTHQCVGYHSCVIQSNHTRNIIRCLPASSSCHTTSITIHRTNQRNLKPEVCCAKCCGTFIVSFPCCRRACNWCLLTAERTRSLSQLMHVWCNTACPFAVSLSLVCRSATYITCVPHVLAQLRACVCLRVIMQLCMLLAHV